MGLSSPDPTTTTPVAPQRAAGVVWDLGNVLIDWQPFAAISAGVGESEARRFLDDFDFGSWNHSCDAGRPWAEAIEEVRRTTPHWYDAARAYHDHFAASLVGDLPGSVALLRRLHEAGVVQLGLTNWSGELFHTHAPPRFDFLALLADIVVSGDEGIAKPDPEIYRRTIARSGLPAEQLVFVDDRADNVAAAQALGMQGVVFTDAEALRSALVAVGLPL